MRSSTASPGTGSRANKRRQSLPALAVDGRWAGLPAPEAGELLLVLDPAEIRWLSGFTGSSAQLLADPAEGRGVLFVDPRYGEQAASELAALHAPITVHVGRTRADTATALAEAAAKRPVRVDARHVSVARWQQICEAIPSALLGVSPIEDARRVKDQAELARMEVAAAIATAALGTVVASGLEGKAEHEVALQLEDAMRAAGAEGPAYPTIVASGPNGARAHHRADSRVICNGDAVVIDVGARVDGYCSDMTRTVFVGEVPALVREMHDAVRAAQQAGLDAVAAEVRAEAVDEACRGVFSDRGMAEMFTHGTGHGVGLEIHEAPLLATGVGDVLRAGEVVTVEPGLYREGLGGVRIEDLVVVTREGVRNLTDAPKDP